MIQWYPLVLAEKEGEKEKGKRKRKKKSLSTLQNFISFKHGTGN